MNYIAVQGCTLKDMVNPGLEISITSVPSTSVKIDGNGVYAGMINILISGTASNGVTIPPATPIPATISASAKSVKVDGQYVVLEGDDTGSLTLSGSPPPGSTSPTTATATIQVISAGQVSVKGE